MGHERKVLSLVLLATVAVLTASCVKIISKPLLLPVTDLKPAGAIVVLGFGPPVDEAGQPVDELRWRVEKGVALYKAGLAPLLVMTGGNTYKDYYEATVMKELAVKLGVPAEAVLEEKGAMDTIGNARLTSKLLRERGIKNIILVSNPYHLSRAVKLFRANDLEVQTAPYDHQLTNRQALTLMLHEYLVRINYLWIDEEALARGEK